MQVGETAPLLRFDRVTTTPARGYDSVLWELSFSLDAGGLLLLRLERDRERLPLADLAQGLFAPAQGRVLYRGRDWHSLPAGQAAALRGRCGRCFTDGGWSEELTLSDNITLAQRHHTRRKVAELLVDAAELARFFGLPGLPLQRPAEAHRRDLGRSALVRAFLGHPELIILEQPCQGMYPEIMPALLNAIGAARRRGAAVIWLTSEPGVWQESGVRATLRGRMVGACMRMEMVEEE